MPGSVPGASGSAFDVNETVAISRTPGVYYHDQIHPSPTSIPMTTDVGQFDRIMLLGNFG